MAYGVIYGMLDKTNYKIYVGQTTNLERRINQHKRDNLYVDNAARAHGWENFVIEVLEECETPEQLDEREIFWIAELDCKFPNGYNLTEGGEGGIRCEEARVNISMAKRIESPYKNLIAEMDKRRLSYTALANLLGLTSVTISDKLRGKSNFTVKAVDKLVEIFNLPAEYLLERDDGLSPITSEAERCKKISARVRHNSPFKNLLREMEKRNLLYADLSKLLGLSNGTLSEKMKGTVKFTSKDIYKLVEIFGKPAEILLERDDGKEFSMSKLSKTPYQNLICEMGLKQLSYRRLAELLSLSPCTVSEKMSGKVNFREQEIVKLTEIFNKTAEYLLQRDDGIKVTTLEAELSSRISVTKRFESPYKNLQKEIDANQFSYRQLAKLLGLSSCTVSEKMNGKYNFTDKDIAKLVEIFGKPADYLMKRDE